jgi:hypothetical protein
MKKICHIDADVTGSKTVSHLVREGHIDTYSCPSFRDCEAVMWGLNRGQIQADIVVLDTITAVAQVARQDIVMDPAQMGKQYPIWDNRERLVAQKQDYYKTADVVNRLLRPLRELYRDKGIASIFIAHERSTRGMESRTDPLSGGDKIIPNLQREINDNLFAYADAIVRLYPAAYPFEYNGQMVPQGTRLLLLAATGDSSVGVRVPADKPPAPPFMIVAENDPYAFVRFIQAIGNDMPANTLIYGPPKIGKTQFVGGAIYL